MEVDCMFPGGNISVESISDDEVRLHQELRDTAIDWFYWCFRVRGAESKSPRFTFTRSRAIGTRGPAMSLDGGTTWEWLGNEIVDGNSFRCIFPAGTSEARLSFAMPYQESDWRRFMAETANRPEVAQGVLCVTPKGRAVEYLLLRSGKEPPKHRVAITCRHHCCEMMANYVLEGLVEWTLRGAEAAWLRENVELLVVPFVDKDGVEDGDQGKGRKPRDHGRDYAGDSIYASTRALRDKLMSWGDGRLHVGLDLHCPYISGAHNEVIYLVGAERERVAAEQKRFSDTLESVVQGPLPFSSADYLPFGQSWNNAANYAGGKSFSRWVAELPEVVLGTSIEIPYANVGDAEVNQASARLFGKDLGRGLAAYLRASDNTHQPFVCAQHGRKPAG